MRSHTNPKLYGGEFLTEVENYFDLDQEKYIVDTWKVLTCYKKHDRFGYWDNLTIQKKSRFENLLWRKWHMNFNRVNKIDFNMGLIPQSSFTGQVVILN